MSSLSPLFAPRGVVVVGASNVPGKLGTAMSESLAGSPVPVALVNSKGGDGMETTIGAAAERLRERGGIADLLISCVPAAATADVVAEAAGAGLRAALVCAGGFAEAGGPGIRLQSDLQRAAQDGEVRVLGPNTSGFFVPAAGLRASFVPGVASLEAGRVAVVASSGGVNHMTCFQLARAGVGISLGVGIGAGFDVTHAQVLDYLTDDETTTAVALHIENVPDGAALLAAVRRLAAVKPVVAFVVGRRTDSAFAQSHTGALATSWRTARSVLAQAGAVIVDDEDQLVAAVSALSLVRLPPTPDAGVGLITGQAGPGLIIDDRATADGWRIPALASDTQAAIGRMLPPLTFQANPVDTGRPSETFPEIVRTVGADPAIDLVAVYALTEPILDLPNAVEQAAAPVPVVIGMDGAAADIAAASAGAAQREIPFLTGPSALGWAVGAIVEDARIRSLAAPDEQEAGTAVTTTGPWDEIRAKELLDSIGIPTPGRRRVTDLEDALIALRELGGPVAVKLVDATVLHKTELGGVHLGISTDAEMTVAITRLRDIGATEFLVERMADSGVDLVVSVRRDPVFGGVAVVGLGGTAAEAIADVAIRSVPIGSAAAEAMVDDLRARALLFGWRGGPQLDRPELARHIRALGATLTANPALTEIEINPLRLGQRGLIALDAVVITTQEEET